ncbi:MAG: SAM-dependent chlorinase/fluorinase [Candidatus Auribacterota bacterium]|nr:SAM-dependent chlorinase/fluorinase [Candidatus Auribacterota bacterium]
MKPITLTTDFGYDSWFVGVMKGVIHGITPDATVIDLIHGIKPFDIRQAAFSLMVSYLYFPAGTIHVAVVDPGVGSARRPILAVSKSYMFIAPDNGLLTPVLLDENPCTVYHVTNTDFFLKNISNTFHGRDIFAPLAAHLSQGANPAETGRIIDDPVILDGFQPPAISFNNSGLKSAITATVIHVDRFGNLITNIPCSFFKESISVTFAKTSTTISGLRKSYDSVACGEPLLILGSSGFLEISVNQGNASERFQMQQGDNISITITN